MSLVNFSPELVLYYGGLVKDKLIEFENDLTNLRSNKNRKLKCKQKIQLTRQSSLDCNNFGFLYAIFEQTSVSAPSTAFYLWRHSRSKTVQTRMKVAFLWVGFRFVASITPLYKNGIKKVRNQSIETTDKLAMKTFFYIKLL